MTVNIMSLEYQRLRAPQDHGQVLQSPELSRFSQHFHENRSLLDGLSFPIETSSIGQLQRQAQVELVDLAFAYTSQYRDVEQPSGDLPVIMSGHQPQLFHPGVWYKNFMLARLATEHRAVGINLLVDNDLGNSTQIKVPTGTRQSPAIKIISYDRAGAAQPFEGRTINRQDLWESFGESVAQTISPLVANPIIRTFWPVVMNNAANMGPEYAIAAGRHAMEKSGENQTLEIPLSTLCDTTAFAIFAAHLLENASQLKTIYNEAIAEYRAVHRIRSQAHPVPELGTRDDFTEIPFWLWRREQPTRQTAFVRWTGNEVQLTNFADVDITLPAGQLSQALQDAKNDGVCLRPRALVTTMYCRLVLCQMFLHGIGGSKYDQLNDMIIHRFFGIQPPVYYTFSSTHHLPVGLSNVRPIDLANVKNQIRGLEFHPENHLTSNGQEFSKYQLEKSELLASIPDRHQKSDWHQRLEQCNRNMQPAVDAQRTALLEQQTEFKRQLAINKILGSREFSFCLFPETIVDELIELVGEGRG